MEEFPDFLLQEPDKIKLVLFIVDKRWCYGCQGIVCMFNEVASNFEENTADFCNEDLLRERTHPHDSFGATEQYDHFENWPWRDDFRLHERDAPNMAETSGVLDYAIVKISDTNVKAAREFMEAFEIGGVPMVKMYKPNGEHIDYMGQLQASKYELIPVLLRNFVAVNVFGESITHPCINFELIRFRNISWIPGSFGVYCRKPFWNDGMKDTDKKIFWLSRYGMQKFAWPRYLISQKYSSRGNTGYGWDVKGRSPPDKLNSVDERLVNRFRYGGHDTEIRSWDIGIGPGHGAMWPDYFWDHHQEGKFFEDPAKDIPGQPDTFEWVVEGNG